jgi:hypothetical protein
MVQSIIEMAKAVLGNASRTPNHAASTEACRMLRKQLTVSTSLGEKTLRSNPGRSTDVGSAASGAVRR